MKPEDKKYLQLVAAHAILGFAVFWNADLTKVYALMIFLVGTYSIVRNQNRNDRVLLACAYIVGAEVFLRMTDGSIFYEYAKYTVMAFILMGVYFSGFSRNGIPYWIFLLLLVPGLIIATQTLGPATDMRKTISFNISGPVCLGVCALYCCGREVSQRLIFDILKWLGLPIISITVFLVFKTPDLREAITGTGSNFATSGGFGPNQVATTLGIGIFIFFSRLVFNSKSKLLFIVNLIIVLNIAFRGLITFSRGGIITGLVMIVALLFFTYLRVRSSAKIKIQVLLIGGAAVFAGIWLYSSTITGGLIDKRYANQDATGKKKESQFSGREKIASIEIKDFMSHPVFGIGVAKGTELRFLSGINVVSHNEITRMLAEHGSFGIMALLILFFTPLINYVDNKNHLFLVPFLIFWLLTINHAAMRLAAPAFVYALSVLKITKYEDDAPAIHRE